MSWILRATCETDGVIFRDGFSVEAFVRMVQAISEHTSHGHTVDAYMGPAMTAVSNVVGVTPLL